MSHRDPAERLRELEQLVGRTVAGKYVVGRLIGRGGMGAVYEGENVSIGKKVA
jgi:serine/threonine protein kinase